MRSGILRGLDALWWDVTHAVRAWRQSPGFTAAVLLSIVIGVAGNVTTLSVVDRLLFQSPSGVVDPSRVRRVFAKETAPGRQARDWTVFSVPDYLDLAASIRGEGAMEGFATTTDRVLGDNGPRVSMSYITGGLFNLFGVRPARGRFFAAEENELRSSGVPPLVISFDLWMRFAGGDTAIIGRRLTVSGTTFVVVGVAPRDFHGIDLDPVDLWVPLGTRSRSGEPGAGDWRSNRDARFLSLVMRLGRDQQWDHVVSRLSTQYSRTQPTFVSTPRILAAPLLAARGPHTFSAVRERGLSLANRLAVAAMSILLVTALNVAALLLMRTVNRRHEIAVRLAIGMSRARLASQLITESLMLALTAGAASVVIGWWASRLLRANLLSTIRWPATGIDYRLILIAASLALAIGLGAALVPVAIARQYNANALRLDTSSSDRTGSRLRAALLGVQTALCVILIAFAGSFLQSIRKITVTNLGFDIDRVIMVVDRPGGGSIGPDALAALGSLPFIESVANATSDVAPDRARGKFAIQGQPPLPDSLAPSHNFVTASYFSTVGLTVVRGRGITKDDLDGSAPVVVITESLARSLWPERDPLRDCVFVVGNTSTCRQVVGIVRDVRWELAGAPIPHLYAPLAQSGRGILGRFWLLRTRSAVTAADAKDIERIVRSTAVGSPPSVLVVRDLLAPQIKPLRAASTLLLVFGILALFLAGCGVYGLVSSELSQRTRELGVRMALGAETRDVLRVVLGAGTRTLAIGIIAGVFGTIACGRLIAAFLFETSPYDPLVMVLVAGTMAAAAFVAMIVPGIRAARLDPAAALRAD